MFLSFYFHHIPDKEKYLAQRYAKDWPAYEASTKALVLLAHIILSQPAAQGFRHPVPLVLTKGHRIPPGMLIKGWQET